MMSFSVDYQFTAGQPDPATPYAWVIERAKGPSARLEVRLADKGTLQGLAQGWLPRHGPFQTHIEDLSGNRLSPSVPLQ